MFLNKQSNISQLKKNKYIQYEKSVPVLFWVKLIENKISMVLKKYETI